MYATGSTSFARAVAMIDIEWSPPTAPSIKIVNEKMLPQNGILLTHRVDMDIVGMNENVKIGSLSFRCVKDNSDSKKKKNTYRQLKYYLLFALLLFTEGTIFFIFLEVVLRNVRLVEDLHTVSG